jgi:(p)ppGpp synthase/HD superfamily hydrolase
MATLERAIQIAAEAHAGQVDKGGAPYVLHPLRVMMAMETDEERIVAVLHDVIEDCPRWPEARLYVEGFSADVLEALDALTRHQGETYDQFVARVKLNPLAARVKLSDLRDNMLITRIPKPNDGDRRRAMKYARAYEFLGGC